MMERQEKRNLTAAASMYIKAGMYPNADRFVDLLVKTKSISVGTSYEEAEQLLCKKSAWKAVDAQTRKECFEIFAIRRKRRKTRARRTKRRSIKMTKMKKTWRKEPVRRKTRKVTKEKGKDEKESYMWDRLSPKSAVSIKSEGARTRHVQEPLQRKSEAEQLLADAASYQQAFAKRSADELPQAWDAFNRYISEVVAKKQTLNISNFCRIGWKVEEGLHQAQMRPHFNISEVFARSCRADQRSQIQAPVQSLTFMEEFNFSKCALRFSEGLTKDRLFIYSRLAVFQVTPAMWTNKIFGIAALLARALSSNLPSAAPGLPLPDRAAGALWGLFVGDALAMPVHWYYGGPEQIRHDFGHLLSGYKKSVHPFPDSIMQLSNTGGGGRGGDEGDVVGGVILHDKKQYWRRGGQFHYHHTLDAGENTLEAVLAREMIRSLTSTGGRFSAQDFQQRYIALMTTPGTHNDTYASTCHRMFFQKWRSGIAPEKCPDNDGHNVDTMDGLVLPSVVALAALVRGDGLEEAAKQGSEALAVTRASSVLPQYVQIMTAFLSKLLQSTPLATAAAQTAEEAYGSDLSEAVRKRGNTDPVVACYIGGSFPALS
eukprot:symbB.v1.2.005181.t1/scaffold298.1/size236510/25